MLVRAASVWLSAAAFSVQALSGSLWRDAPGYLRLFAPSGSRAAAYRTYVSPLPLERVLAEVTTDPSAVHPPGAWSPTPVLPADAFGQTGGYDRSKLARLYGSRRPVVARGPRGVEGRATEAWTLISPYPSQDMGRLESGTLLIVFDLQSGGS